MNSPLITFVITTYMRPAETVIRAVNCALNQTYKNTQIIVVDDSPQSYPLRDEVEKAVKQAGDITYIKQQKNMGACIARNTGLENAEGEFIAFLDDDDEWLPEKTERELAAFKKTDAFVYCASQMIDDKQNKSRESRFYKLSGYAYKKLLYMNYIGSTSIPLIRTEALRKIGGFDPLMRSAQDYDVWLRLTKENTVSYIEETLVIRHFFGDAQITTDYKKRIDGLLRINEKNKASIEMDKELIWKRNLDVSKFYAADSQKLTALKIWLKYFWLMPLKPKENLSVLKAVLKNQK